MCEINYDDDLINLYVLGCLLSKVNLHRTYWQLPLDPLHYIIHILSSQKQISLIS